MKAKKTKTAALVKSAAIIAIGSFLAKAIGAVYRVPLTNLLGSYGLGLYQMVFPVYSMLLTLSATGVPTVLSKLVAERGEEEGKKILLAALTVLPAAGFLLALFMAVFCGSLATLQGDSAAKYCYLALAPSIFFVSSFAAVRGYFQGKMQMVPTAVSQIIEQTVKLVVGLICARAFLPSAAKAAAGAALGVSVSELCAALFLFLLYKRKCGRLPRLSLKARRPYIVVFLKTLLPVVAIGILPPLTGVISGFYTIPLLSKTVANATAQFGAYFGGVTSVVGVPVALCYGIAVAVLPAISRLKESEPVSEGAPTVSTPISQTGQAVTAPKMQEKSGESMLSSYRFTLFIALPSCVFCCVFARKISSVLFFQLSAEEIALSARLLRISAWQIPLLSLIQTGNAVLISQGKAKPSALSLAVSCAVELVLGYLLLSRGTGIFSLPISAIIGYFVATFFNLVYSMKGKITAHRRRLFFAETAMELSVTLFSAWVAKRFAALLSHTVLSLAVAFLVFAALYLICRAALAAVEKSFYHKRRSII